MAEALPHRRPAAQRAFTAATLAALLCAMLALVAGWPRGEPRAMSAALAPAALAADAEGYLQALEPRVFTFPDDHAAHPGYRTEWWYLTGNLQTVTGRRFGYQVTLFRRGLSPQPAERASHWGTGAMYFAHIGLSDASTRRFHSAERYARDALALAGADTDGFWIGDWAVSGTPDSGMDLRVTADAFSLAFRIEPGALVLRGHDGLSAKSAAAGNNSYYFAAPRLETDGTIKLGGQEHAVKGQSWFDREWSSSALDRQQTGWDWIAVHLDDGRDLMLFQLRAADGRRDFAAAEISDATGGRRQLDADEITLEPVQWWRSDASGHRYPIRWRVAVAELGLSGELRAVFPDQEHRGDFRYWEGMVDLKGSHPGHGYLEMTGY
ncbi:MAG: carotenoid 1,2-hydratase [Planctomycetota bacterium]|jgi:predicted secreted hydrolase|nr:carotenoid 1,2-hydratase [Planctomycetota bacterium]